jgi:tRNA-splicing ligase RtcB
MNTKELDDLGKPYRIYAESLEDEALRQFTDAMKLDCVVKGALMPDAHTGYSLPIGAVVAVDGMVFPSFVGYDIGCGVCALPTSYSVEAVRKHASNILEEIYQAVPVGFSHNLKETNWDAGKTIPCTQTLAGIFNKNGLFQLGSLGGGNHFAEIGVDEEGKVWIVIHSGSRGIGHAVANHYMRLASGDGKAREGNFSLSTLSSEGKDYIQDLNFCLEFALENRHEIMRRIVSVLDSFVFGRADWSSLINRNHNHAEYKDGLWIHRKGATHAEEGMMGVVPGNMLDGSFIVKGKGNPDSLWSSSHGAGRVLGRKEAKRVLNMDTFIDSMAGVTAHITEDILDESPLAYKSIFKVMEQQTELVDVVAHVRPIINVKG